MQKALNYVLSGVVLYLTVVACSDNTDGSGKPVITLLGESPIDVPVDAAYIDAEATAYDPEDGNITNRIDTVNTVDETTLGTYSVTYNVTDTSGRAADEKVRTVNVVDNVTPVITLTGVSYIEIALDTIYTDDGATALDTEDGDITGDIVTDNPVNETVPGTYVITYDVMDSLGASAIQVTRTVVVIGATDGPVL